MTATYPIVETHPEATFLGRLQAGEASAYEELVARYTERLMRLAHRYLSCESDCEDAVQEAFFSVFRSVTSFRGGCRLSTWLHRILVNVCLMKLRSNGRKKTTSFDDLINTELNGFAQDHWAVEENSEEDRLEKAEQSEQLREQVEALPTVHRQVIELRNLQDYNTEQTALLLGIRPGAVKTRLHRAHASLRKQLLAA